jgi:hypothetical protein
MKRALLALLLTACSVETTFVPPTDVDDSWIRDEAAAAWASVGVDAPSDYDLLFLDADALLDACGGPATAPGTQLGGCAVVEANVVLLRAGASPEQQTVNLIHELGHLMHGDAHLDCGADSNRGLAFGGDVMCVSGAGPTGRPTARDAEFVR